MRIKNHPILEDLKNRKKIYITVNGRKVEAYEGEPIAAAMYAASIRVHRITPKYNEPRGIFCNRGRCTDCIMKVDGKPNVRTCVTLVKNGMKVESIKGMGDWSE